MTRKSVRVVRDLRKEDAPYHMIEGGGTEAMCGEDCTGYTYAIINPSKVKENVCVTCYQKYLDWKDGSTESERTGTRY